MKAELYILGVLHRGDFHPYEIKRRLNQAMIECFTNVDVGTLYYAVRQLAKCELLHAQFAAEGDLRETLYGPMLFLHLADFNLVAEALNSQIERQNARLAEIRKLKRQWVAMLPTGSRHLMQHMTEQCRFDLRWLRAVLADVKAGRIRDTPDPARLASQSEG